MNVSMAKFIMFQTVHRLDAEGYSISKLHSITGLNRRTIKKYLLMAENEFEVLHDRMSSRKKQLLPYEEFVRNKLQLYSDTSAAQMHDWLKESYTDFPTVNAKTVFNFVHWIRDKYNIPVLQKFREYEIVPELPYGKQAQVDFGEYTLRTSRDSFRLQFWPAVFVKLPEQKMNEPLGRSKPRDLRIPFSPLLTGWI